MGRNRAERVVEGLQSFLLQVGEAETAAHEAAEPNSLVDFLDSEAQTGQDYRAALSLQADASAGDDEDTAVARARPNHQSPRAAARSNAEIKLAATWSRQRGDAG